MGEYFSHAAACIIGVQLNDCFLLRKLDMNFDYLFRSSYMPV